jgi:hypothetical protein
MVLPVILVLFGAAIAVLYAHLREQTTRQSLWRSTFRIGLAIGVARAALASWGWYIVEHTGGPLQIPAFALAMLAWPEGAILSVTRIGATPPGFYVSLSLVLITSTMIIVGLVAVVADSTRVAAGQER